MFHVKHEETLLGTESITQRVAGIGIDLSGGQAELLARHAKLVLEQNQRMNLTRITSPAEVLDLHIVDSLAFLPQIDVPPGKWVDIGSGAGFPGVPLAILGFNVTLCESVKKKAAFLASAVEQLGLAASVMPVRAEELAADRPEAFNVVVARALSSLPALVELASPLLSAGGRLIAMKGRPEADERLQAVEAGRVTGMRLIEEAGYVLPNGDGRTVFVYERGGRAKVSLPRRPGMAQRQPLGTKGV